jgi:hypothetical protein
MKEITKTAPVFALIANLPSKSVILAFCVPLTRTVAPIKGAFVSSVTTPVTFISWADVLTEKITLKINNNFFYGLFVF